MVMLSPTSKVAISESNSQQGLRLPFAISKRISRLGDYETATSSPGKPPTASSLEGRTPLPQSGKFRGGGKKGYGGGGRNTRLGGGCQFASGSYPIYRQKPSWNRRQNLHQTLHPSKKDTKNRIVCCDIEQHFYLYHTDRKIYSI